MVMIDDGSREGFRRSLSFAFSPMNSCFSEKGPKIWQRPDKGLEVCTILQLNIFYASAASAVVLWEELLIL